MRFYLALPSHVHHFRTVLSSHMDRGQKSHPNFEMNHLGFVETRLRGCRVMSRRSP